MKFNQKLIWVLAAATLLPACSMVGPNYTRPETTLTPQYTEAVADSTEQAPISKTWWTLYGDSTLNGLVDTALSNNVDVQLAVAKIEEADAVMRQAGAALLPEFDVNGSASRSRVSEVTATPFPAGAKVYRPDYKATIGTAFELDFWGKLRRANEAARAQALSSRYGKDTVSLSLAGLVVQDYLQLRSLDAQIAVANESQQIRLDSLTLTQNRAKGGVASDLDVHQAEAAVATLKAQIADLVQQRALFEHQLALLTGKLDLKVATSDLRQLPIPPTPPAGLPSSLLEARPDIRQAEQTLVAANAKIGVARAAMFPSISLTSNLGGQSADLGDIIKSAARIWTFGLSLNLPIFDNGRLQSLTDQAIAQQKQSIAAYQKAIQAGFTEVNDALITLQQSKEKETALEMSVAASKKSLTIAQNRYQAGYSGFIDVLDSQRTLNDASLSLIQSRQSRLIASVSLFKALGGGWYTEEKTSTK